MGEAISAELEARILEDRSDPAAHLIYADWLQAQGDPRGELIVIQHALRNQHEASKAPFDRIVDPPSGRLTPYLPNTQELVRAERELAKKHLSEWLGPIMQYDAQYAHFRWRFGFIDEARFKVADAIFNSKRDLIADVLSRPVARLVRSLKIRLPGWGNDPKFFEALEDFDSHAALETVRIVGPRWPARPAPRALNVARFAARFPRLRSLRIDTMFQLDMNALDLPKLERLDFSVGLEAGECALTQANLPHLHTLAITGRERPDVLADLRPFLASGASRRMKRLHLRTLARGDELLEAVIHSPILRRLELLDLTGCMFTPDAARMLIESADRFRHLRHLALPHEILRPGDREALRAIGPLVSGWFAFSRRSRIPARAD